MELLTTIPIRLINPMKAVKEKEYPVIYRASTDPIMASGNAEKMMNGWENDLNCKTRTAKIAINAMRLARAIPPKLSSRLSNSPVNVYS